MTILFLKFNAGLWDLLIVQKAHDIHIKKQWDECVKDRVTGSEEQEEDLKYEEEDALVG